LNDSVVYLKSSFSAMRGQSLGDWSWYFETLTRQKNGHLYCTLSNGNEQ